MSFRKEYIKEQSREVKQIKKTLPYTVRSIKDNDIGAWRKEQSEKQERWEAGRAERYAEAKYRAVSVLTGERKPTETVQDIADKRYDQLAIQEARIKIDEAREQLGFQKLYVKQSFWEKLLNFFLSIKFE